RRAGEHGDALGGEGVRVRVLDELLLALAEHPAQVAVPVDVQFLAQREDRFVVSGLEETLGGLDEVGGYLAGDRLGGGGDLHEPPAQRLVQELAREEGRGGGGQGGGGRSE